MRGRAGRVGRVTAADVPLWRTPAMRRLVVVTLLGFVSFALTIAALPLYAVRGGAGAGAAGLVTTAMLAATVSVQTLVPAITARLGLGPTLAVGLALLGAPAPLYLLNHDLWWLLVVSAIRGVGFAVLTVLGSTLTALIAPPEKRGEAVGLYGLAIAIPNLVAVPGGTALTAAGEFAWVAWLAAAPVLAVPAALRLGRGVRMPAVPSGSSRGAVRAVLLPTVVLLAMTLAGGGLVTFLPIERPSGLLAAIALLLMGVTSALTRWLAGLLADRIGTRVLLPVCIVLGAAGMVAVAAGLLAGRGTLGTGLVAGGAALLGAGYGAVQNLTLLVAFARAGPDHTTTASAVWNAGFDLGTAIGALAVGVLATGITLPWSFVGCAVLLVLSLPVAAVATRPRPATSGHFLPDSGRE